MRHGLSDLESLILIQITQKERTLKNANKEEDHYNGAEQPLAIELRKKKPGEKRQKIWVGTMAHAPTFGSLSYGGFTKVRLSIVQ